MVRPRYAQESHTHAGGGAGSAPPVECSTASDFWVVPVQNPGSGVQAGGTDYTFRGTVATYTPVAADTGLKQRVRVGATATSTISNPGFIYARGFNDEWAFSYRVQFGVDGWNTGWYLHAGLTTGTAQGTFVPPGSGGAGLQLWGAYTKGGASLNEIFLGGITDASVPTVSELATGLFLTNDREYVVTVTSDGSGDWVIDLASDAGESATHTVVGAAQNLPGGSNIFRPVLSMVKVGTSTAPRVWMVSMLMTVDDALP